MEIRKVKDRDEEREVCSDKNRQSGLDRFYDDMREVSYGTYKINPPLIKPSKLTLEENDGVGKELSDGYALNFAVGCTHACRFCYVDVIHKRFTLSRLQNDIIARSWGMYLLVPENIEEAIEKTEWSRWKGKEVMLSSTHDPYLPELAKITRRILEVSLPEGVKYCIQTRSVLVRNDLDLLAKYREQVRLQVSIATLNDNLARMIEPRVPPPKSRLNVLRDAKAKGITTGVIIAPIFPVEGWREDLELIFNELASIGVNHVYGELLHVRGMNLGYIAERGLSFPTNRRTLARFDKLVGQHFGALLRRYRLNGIYWYEYCK